MPIKVYEFVPDEPGEQTVKLKIDTIYNYSFYSEFTIRVVEQAVSGDTAESSIRLPSSIICTEGETTEVMICEANPEISSIIKLSGPGQIVKKLGAYIWQYTPDYFVVPYYLPEKEETLIIVSSELGRGTFVHSTIVKIINRTRQPTPLDYTMIVEENRPFKISLSNVIENPDNIPISSVMILEQEIGSETTLGGLNEVLLNNYVLNLGVEETTSGSTAQTEQVRNYISIIGDSIVGKFPVGFVERSTIAKEIIVYWLAIFTNGKSIYGQIKFIVIKSKAKLEGKYTTVTVSSGEVRYIDIFELFDYELNEPLVYNLMTNEGTIEVIQGRPKLKLYIPTDKFQFPISTISKTYVIQAQSIDGQIAYSTVFVTYVHTFKPVKFLKLPVFRVHNFQKAKLKLNNYLFNIDNVPISKIEVLQQGYKPLNPLEIYGDDRDKTLFLRSTENMSASGFGFQPFWNDNLSLKDFSI